MAKDKKKDILLMIGGMKPKGKGMSEDDSYEDKDDSEEMEDEDEEMTPEQLMFAEEAMAALDSDDAESFAEALKGFVNLCKYE